VCRFQLVVVTIHDYDNLDLCVGMWVIAFCFCEFDGRMASCSGGGCGQHDVCNKRYILQYNLILLLK